jgi:hypothetical protein
LSDITQDTRDLLVRLNRMLDYSGQWIRRLDAAYENRQPLTMLPPEVLEACGNRLPELRVGFCQLAVDLIEERLNIEGFRLPDEAPGSSKIWNEIWQPNQLDEYSQQAHLESLIHGNCNLLVWSGADGRPRITVESARQSLVWTMPGNPHRIAGIKRWLHHDGRARCTLFLPDVIYKFESPNRISLDPYLGEAQLFSAYSGYSPYGEWWDFSAIPSTGWILRDDPIPNALGVVPLIPLRNRPRLLSWGSSELIPVLPLVSAVNKLATDMMVASEFHATPRRWVTGIEIQTDAEGNAVDPFPGTKGRNWMAENPETRFGMFEGSSMSNFTDAILALTNQIGALMSIPPHLLGVSREPASADAIRSSEIGLVTKVRRKQRALGLGWEECMRLALSILEGYRRPGIQMLETIWSSPESRGVAAEADAAGKLAQMGIPLPQVAEDFGYSPQEIERMDTAAQATPVFTATGPPPSPEHQREVERSSNGAV